MHSGVCMDWNPKYHQYYWSYQYCWNTKTPSIKEWWVQALDFTDMGAEHSNLLKEKSVNPFVNNWKPLIDILISSENNDLMMRGSDE